MKRTKKTGTVEVLKEGESLKIKGLDKEFKILLKTENSIVSITDPNYACRVYPHDAS